MAISIPPPEGDYIVTTRGGLIENRHAVHASIVTPSGPLYATGDPSRLTLIRSAAKPAQTVAILESLAAPSPTSTLPPDFDPSPADISLMSASHSAEPRHLQRATAILERGANKPSDLKCGGHPSITKAINDGWIRDGITPTGLHNGCSGKHGGMLAAARALGADTATYHLPEHTVQQRVKEVVEDLVGEVPWAVDGCNLPAPAMPLTGLAEMYLAFAVAADEVGDAAFGDASRASVSTNGGWNGPSATSTPTNGTANGATRAKSSPSQSRTETMARVFAGMSAHPHMVGGEGRFCTVLAEAFPGMVVGKVGAEACYGIAIRADPASGRPALGVGVKIEDGNLEMVYHAVAEIVERLQIGTAEQRAALDAWRTVVVRNTAGEKVGSMEFPFVLRDVE